MFPPYNVSIKGFLDDITSNKGPRSSYRCHQLAGPDVQLNKRFELLNKDSIQTYIYGAFNQLVLA